MLVGMPAPAAHLARIRMYSSEIVELLTRTGDESASFTFPRSRESAPILALAERRDARLPGKVCRKCLQQATIGGIQK